MQLAPSQLISMLSGDQPAVLLLLLLCISQHADGVVLVLLLAIGIAAWHSKAWPASW